MAFKFNLFNQGIRSKMRMWNAIRYDWLAHNLLEKLNEIRNSPQIGYGHTIRNALPWVSKA
jgi:hypothetical protein